MFKGVAPVIAIILLIGITVGGIISAYIGITGLTNNFEHNTEKSIIDKFDARGADLKVDVFGNCKIYLRNTGTKDIPMEAISFYIDDKPANYEPSTGIFKMKNIIEISFSGLSYKRHDVKIKLMGNLLDHGYMVCSATPKTCAQLNGVCCNPNPCLSGKILWASDCSECCANLSDCFISECATNSECADFDSCTNDICSNGLCSNTQITTCINNDGCCPSNGNSTSDNDCVLECATNSECADFDSCTNDICSNGLCSNTQITTCINNDGCCPSGCVYAVDNDCVDPTTCDAQSGVCCNSGQFCKWTPIPSSDCSLCCSPGCTWSCDFVILNTSLTTTTVGSTAYIKTTIKNVGEGVCSGNLDTTLVFQEGSPFTQANPIIGDYITTPVNIPSGGTIQVYSISRWTVKSGIYYSHTYANRHVRIAESHPNNHFYRIITIP